MPTRCRALTSYGWSLPGDTLRALLLDPDDEDLTGAVREAVVRNAGVPTAAVLSLAGDFG